MLCPSCGVEYPAVQGGKCPRCGADAPADAPDRPGLPWQQLHKYGFILGFVENLTLVLFSPRVAFRRMRLQPGYLNSLCFLAIAFCLAGLPPLLGTLKDFGKYGAINGYVFNFPGKAAYVALVTVSHILNAPFEALCYSFLIYSLTAFSGRKTRYSVCFATYAHTFGASLMWRSPGEFFFIVNRGRIFSLSTRVYWIWVDYADVVLLSGYAVRIYTVFLLYFAFGHLFGMSRRDSLIAGILYAIPAIGTFWLEAQIWQLCNLELEPNTLWDKFAFDYGLRLILNLWAATVAFSILATKYFLQNRSSRYSRLKEHEDA
ncbi:MAG TPA: hypothetical protein PL033_06540 [Candidatus Brocadiia bacterium]|nr:hypothetical protein [Candidatus Brocadiia bacterium]